MGGGGGSPPTFNAAQTAQQQSQANVQTGVANSLLNNTNQVTPYGNLTYNQTGTTNVGGNDVPSFTATQTLSPDQQSILNKTTGLQNQALDAAGPLFSRVGQTLATPLNFDNAPKLNATPLLGGLSAGALGPVDKLNGIDLSYTGPTDPTALRNSAYSALTSRSTPDLQRAWDQQQTQLQNQGIAQGSDAWNHAQELQNRAITDASNQATINAGTIANQDAQNAATLAGARSTLANAQSGVAGTVGNLYGTAGNLEQATFAQNQALRNQTINEDMTLRNSPLQDYSAIMGFSGGVQQPTFTNTPSGQIPPTDVTTPALAQFQGQQNAFNMQNQNNQATTGGLFGLGGSVLGGVARALPWGTIFSDERLKENIAPIGETFDGQNLYSYNYKGDSTPQVGLMAQEVEKRDPGAVLTLPSGFKAVNYPRALKKSMFGF